MMKCPQCNAASSVLSTRNLTERRRECFNGHRFNTTEVVETEEPANNKLIHLRMSLARTILRQKGYLQ